VADRAVVLIAQPEQVRPLADRLGAEGQVASFTDDDVVRALAAILDRKPAVVALSQSFAVAPRGAALIDRIRADRTLAATRIRIVPEDPAASYVDGRAGLTSVPAPATIDGRGTRKTPRYRVVGPLAIAVDGNEATLVDLSASGAQVLSTAVVRPNQRVRALLSDDSGSIRLTAQVVWAAFEIPAHKPRYRAGLSFLNPDHAVLMAYCERHGQPEAL